MPFKAEGTSKPAAPPGSSRSPNSGQVSNNPFRQRVTASASSLSHDGSNSESSINGVRKTTPSRTVFADLPSAHSIITSKSARLLSDTHVQSFAENPERNDIPLRTLVPSRDAQKHLPRLSVKPVLPTLRRPEFTGGRESFSKKDDYSNQSSKYHSYDRETALERDGIKSLSRNTTGPYEEVMRIQGSPSTLSLHDPGRVLTPPVPPRSPRRVDHYHTASTTEGSVRETDTLGNLYKLYDSAQGTITEPELPSNRHLGKSDKEIATDCVDLNSAGRNPVKPSAIEVRKQRRIKDATNEPFQSYLTAQPNLELRVLQSSSRQGGPSSSFGDTGNLLNLTEQRSPWTTTPSVSLKRSDAQTDLQSAASRSDGDHVVDERSAMMPSKNPYTNQPVRVPLFNDNKNDDGGRLHSYHHYNKGGREPLEREVSKALRRASGFSFYSTGSLTTSVQEEARRRGAMPGSISIGQLRRLEIGEEFPAPSSPEKQGDGIVSFYNEAAVAASWVDSNRLTVRVPIKQKLKEKDYSTHEASGPVMDSFVTENEDGDWVTEQTSEQAGRHYYDNQTSPVYLGGLTNRAGSSIANYSDDEKAGSSTPDLNPFNYTERIVKHPGDNLNSNAYRLRNLKDTNQPVILPTRKDHTTNGYLANSNRYNPSTPTYNYTPSPLPNPHRNPFTSSPPDIWESSDPSQPRHVNLKAGSSAKQEPSSPLEFEPTFISDITEGSYEEPQIYVSKPRPSAERTYRIGAWVEDLNHPSSPSNRHHTDVQQGPVEGHGSQGIHISRPKETYRQSSKMDLGVDGSTPRNTAPMRRPLVIGGPGAFYRGLQARKNKVHKPQELLRRHSIPEGMKPSGSALGQDGYSYRSPLAPPRRASTYELYDCSSNLAHVYNQSELDRNYATRDGNQVDQTSPHGKPRLRDYTDWHKNNRTSRYTLLEYPRLQRKPIEPLSRNLNQTKHRISLIILCLCNLLPPLLLLYAFGYMDAIVFWWTAGEISACGKDHKSWAAKLVGAWVLLLIAGLVAYIIFFLVHRYG